MSWKEERDHNRVASNQTPEINTIMSVARMDAEATNRTVHLVIVNIRDLTVNVGQPDHLASIDHAFQPPSARKAAPLASSGCIDRFAFPSPDRVPAGDGTGDDG